MTATLQRALHPGHGRPAAAARASPENSPRKRYRTLSSLNPQLRNAIDGASFTKPPEPRDAAASTALTVPAHQRTGRAGVRQRPAPSQASAHASVHKRHRKRVANGKQRINGENALCYALGGAKPRAYCQLH